MAPNSQFITSSDGAKIYADATGNPDKPSIVFVHGLSYSSVVFDSIFSDEGFSNEFYLVRYDMRGHGRSAKPDTIEGYSSILYADDFAAIKKAFGLRRPILVGWSLGATVAVDIVSHLPDDTIAGIVYLNAVPYIGSIIQRIGTPTIYDILPRLLCEDSVQTSIKAIADLYDGLFMDPSTIPWELKCLWTGMGICQTPAHRTFVMTRPQDPKKLFELGENGFPVLILNGTKDKIVCSDFVVAEMQPLFKNLELALIEKGGSHAVFYENTEEVMDRITKFAVRVHATSGDDMAPNSQLITSSDGAKIYADAVGDPTKPSIVFIHGFSLSAVVFDVIFSDNKYKSDFYLVRYDMRGHGRSAKPDTIEGYASKLYADDFDAVKKTFKLEKPFVVGWSLGAAVVADIASYLPDDSIAGVVYLCALPYIDGAMLQRVTTPIVLDLIAASSREDSVETFLKTTSDFFDSLFIDPATIPWETKCLWTGMAACQTPAHKQFVVSRPQDPARLLELGGKGLPLLIVYGAEDKQIVGEAVAAEMKPFFKDLKIAMIKKGGSHAVFYENTEEVMDRITLFTLRYYVRTLLAKHGGSP
ncbi:hypothetical protein M0805_002248 [Coniferiporia weirii]|nr:hypothetical protein M0805_002248 [Coniferiporia weirii]